MRALFEIPEGVHYLNCAYMAPLARPVREAGEAGVRRKGRPWELSPGDFFEEVEEVRGLFAALIDADAEGVSIAPSASYGAAVAAANLPPLDGDVLILDGQFPSNVYPWRAKAATEGREVIAVPRPEDGDWTRAVLDRLDAGIALLALPHCHWADGGLLDLGAIGGAARSVGARLVLDVTQSLGALPLRVADVAPDFLFCAGYKWLLGPYAYAFLYAAPEHRDGRPIEHNWINRRGAEDFAGLVRYTDDFAEGARRYDVGEKSNFALTPMMKAALALVTELDPARIQATLSERNRALARRAGGLGFEAVPEGLRAGHYLALRRPGLDPEDLGARLRKSNVHVSVRGDRLRVTPHLYNDDADVEALLEALSR